MIFISFIYAELRVVCDVRSP